MSKYFNICNLYILLWCLYSLQGTLYATGSIISQGILVIVLIISVYYAVLANIRYTFPPYMKVLNLLVAMFTVYGVALLLSGEVLVIKEGHLGVVSNKDYLKNVYMSLLPIYTFFIFGKIGLLTESIIRRWVPLFVIVAIAAYFENQNAALARAEEIMSMQEEFTNNAGYLFLAIVPSLMFIKKPIWQYLLLLACGVFIISSMKRGAIIIYAISLIPFFYWTLRNTSFKRKITLFILVICCAFAIVYYVSYMLDTSEYFDARLEQTFAGDASNREDMYPILLRQIFYFATPLQLLFGHGAWGTLKVSDNFAHNDWLEIGINQGMIGLAVYVIYWFTFFKTAIALRQNQTLYGAIILTALSLSIKTMFSMSYDSMPIYASICIGYCMANYPNKDTRYEKGNMLYR